MPRDTCHSYNIVASRPSRVSPSLSGTLSNQLSQNGNVGDQGHEGNFCSITYIFKIYKPMVFQIMYQAVIQKLVEVQAIAKLDLTLITQYWIQVTQQESVQTLR